MKMSTVILRIIQLLILAVFVLFMIRWAAGIRLSGQVQTRTTVTMVIPDSVDGRWGKVYKEYKFNN